MAERRDVYADAKRKLFLSTAAIVHRLDEDAPKPGDVMPSFVLPTCALVQNKVVKYRPVIEPIEHRYGRCRFADSHRQEDRSSLSTATMASGSMRSRNSILTCRALTSPS
jgi:hypothetical protein